jgi:hypothetical protein
MTGEPPRSVAVATKPHQEANRRGSGHDYGNHRADGSAGARPRRRWSGSCGGDS